MRRYEVYLELRATTTIEVDAENEDEAQEIAIEQVQHEDLDFECEVVGTVEVDPNSEY